MRVIVINPHDHTIAEHEISGKPYDTIKGIIGSGLECARIDAKNCIWVDEEGLLKLNQYFRHSGYHQPLAGIGVVTGLTHDGDFASTKLYLETVVDAVTFGGVTFVGFEDTQAEFEGITIFSRRAIFR